MTSLRNCLKKRIKQISQNRFKFWKSNLRHNMTTKSKKQIRSYKIVSYKKI